VEPAHFGVESGAALRDDSFEEEVGGEAECTERSKGGRSREQF
jgi:hypothetical protein